MIYIIYIYDINYFWIIGVLISLIANLFIYNLNGNKMNSNYNCCENVLEIA